MKNNNNNNNNNDLDEKTVFPIIDCFGEVSCIDSYEFR